MAIAQAQQLGNQCLTSNLSTEHIYYEVSFTHTVASQHVSIFVFKSEFENH